MKSALPAILTILSLTSAQAAEIRPPFLTLEDQRQCIDNDAACLKWIYQKALVSKIVEPILIERGFEKKTAFFLARNWDAQRYDFETGVKILPKPPMVMTAQDAVAFAHRIPQCLSDMHTATCQIRFAAEYGCNLQRDFMAVCRRGFQKIRAKFAALPAEGRNYAITFSAAYDFNQGVGCLFGPNGGDIPVFDAGPAAAVTKLVFDANAEAVKFNVAALAQRSAAPAPVAVAPTVTPAPACKAVIRAMQWRSNEDLTDGQALPGALEVVDTNEFMALQRKSEPVPPGGAGAIAFNDLPDGWLGMELGRIEDRPASKATLPRASVISVAPGGPAARAGIQRGDFILRIGGRAVDDAMYLGLHMTEAPIGKPMNVVHQRDGKSIAVALTAIDLEEAARLNDAVALRHLGDFFARQNERSDANVAKQRGYHEKSAALGDLRAIVNLAESFASSAAPKDKVEARTWYERAANLGHLASMRRIGEMHQMGEGGAKDMARALEWFSKGAEKGDIAQMSDIADLYLEERKFPEARQWWEKIVAADKSPLKREGDRFRNKAAFQLASAMLDGVGGPRDLVEGRKLLERVAVAGEREAIESGYLLGKLLSASAFGPPDLVKAKFWYERAAKHGNTEAMFALGMMHKDGIGIPKNPLEARRWITAAAENKHAGASKELLKLPQISGPPPKPPSRRPDPP